MDRLNNDLVNIGNKLPADVLAANSLNVFRRRLKTHLFTAAFAALEVSHIMRYINLLTYLLT